MSVALVAGGLALAPAPAEGQSAIKPYVMLMFDSSGSMRYPTCRDGYEFLQGDNSNECQGNLLSCATCSGQPATGCGNGLHDDARLYKLKSGASAVISAYGEVIFGMARFHQEPATFTCHYDADVIRRSGGWIGAPDHCNNAAMGTGFNRADVLVPFSDTNQTELLSWLNNCDDYPNDGNCQLGVMPGSGTEPTTPTNCAAGSLCAECGTGCDKELRGAGWTAIAGSLYHLRNSYFNGTSGVIATDPQSTCRPYKVILLTDGDDQCPGDQIAQAAALYNNPGKSIPVHVIGFANSALRPNLDNVAAAGGTGQAIMVDDEIGLAIAIAQIVSESLLRETCNNADDDCNGQCDELWPEVGVSGAGCSNTRAAQTCTAGLGICQRTGTYQCRADGSGSECSVTPGPPAPGGEICNNGLDDDCDGAVDEECTPCVPQAEICNGKDDDCDGLVDEEYGAVPCGSDVGACERGITACVNGNVICQGSTGPGTELCDNIDNNCDTVVDDFTQTCFADAAGAPFSGGCNLGTGACVGRCQLGLRRCTMGSWGSCQGAVGPTAEVCNGADDNCDGQVDEGVLNNCTNFATCQPYTSCAACPQTPIEICNLKDDDCDGTTDNIAGKPCGTDIGECQRGVTACDATGKEICQGAIGPQAETCNGKDDDCNGKIDDGVGAPVGQSCSSNVGECKPGVYQCIAGKIRCVGAIESTPEICDGKDNDCNGLVDDGIAALPCGSDVGECRAGATACVAGALVCQGAVGPSPEICDGLDNDCNGISDDHPSDVGKACGSSIGACVPGQEQCVNGKLTCVGAVGAKPEICDGLDNDCDGTVDNNIAGVGATCGSDTGECQAGTQACQQTPNGWALRCTGEIGPSPEVCDGKDNDCNGQTDEDYPEKGQVCGSNIGECKAGTYNCLGGKLVCEGGGGGVQETCNGKDDDCNGVIDDNVTGEGQPCGDSTGECKPGATKCIGGQMLCMGKIGPGQEICDGKDNNCDGQVDENASCPGGSSCHEGQCLLPCASGEFKCPGGTRCENGYCIPLACAACKDTERCVDDKCVEKCSGVSCEAHERCEPTTGRCVDDSCLSKGCPEGQLCIAYSCQKDPCAGVSCDEGRMCIAGTCKDTCVGKTCPTGQRCHQGECVSDDPCVGHKCQENFICESNNGKPRCVADPCRVVSCTPGQVCREGKCVDDPCLSTRCPSYMECKRDHLGRPDCVLKPGATPPSAKKMLATGAGGFGCAVTSPGADGSLLWLWGLLGAALLLRRRRH